MCQEKEAFRLRHLLIVQAALSCFTQQGFHQTSMRDIARKANISLGNLYNYFASKEALIEAIAKLEAKEQDALLSILKDAQPLIAIQKFTETYLEQLSQADNVKLLAEVIAECTRSPKIAQFFSTNHQVITSALTATIERGVQTGDIRPDLSPQILAELILDGIEGVAIRKALFVNSTTHTQALIELLLTLIKASDAS